MRTIALLATVAGALLAQPAAALVFTSGTGTITSTDLVQTNRVSRDATLSAWAAQKAFPGTIAQTPTYDDLINATFASNAVQTIYYEITYSTTQTAVPLPFASPDARPPKVNQAPSVPRDRRRFPCDPTCTRPAT